MSSGAPWVEQVSKSKRIQRRYEAAHTHKEVPLFEAGEAVQGPADYPYQQVIENKFIDLFSLNRELANDLVINLNIYQKSDYYYLLNISTYLSL